MRIKKGDGLILLGMLLIFASGALTVWNMYDENRARQSAETVIEQLQEELTVQAPPETVPEETQPPVIPEETEPPEPVPYYRQEPVGEMPAKMISGRPYIGVLSIPVLGLELPVIQTWNYSDLRRSPCRYVGSAYTDDLVIAAHNYVSHFGNLKKLQTGDQILFTDMDGNVFTYEVAVLETLQPTAVEEMTSGEWPLSLFTCTIGGKLRVTVRCDLIGEEENLNSPA